MWFGSSIAVDAAVAVAWASSCSFDSTSSLGESVCHRGGPKNTRKKKKKRQNSIMILMKYSLGKIQAYGTCFHDLNL